MEETQMREILFALAQTGINLSPSAFRFLISTPQPKEALSQLVINYFTSKYVRKTLSAEDVGEILNISPDSLPKSTADTPIDMSKEPAPQAIESSQTAPSRISLSKGNSDALTQQLQDDRVDIADDLQESLPPSPQIPDPSFLAEKTPPLNSTMEQIPPSPSLELTHSSIESIPPEIIENNPNQIKNLGGVANWNPIARGYASDVKVISDPTKELYSNGEIDDFLKVFSSRYEKLRKILQQRWDSNDVIPISEVKTIRGDQDVKIIGMVIDKRQTKTHNFLVELEDPTGRITILINQKNPEIYNLVPNLMLDQVICVSGLLRVNEGKSRMIFVQDFYWPDIPLNFRPKHTEDRVCAMCISDIHVGSKEFLRPVWNRMVDYLNGRIGNERQRELAGEVKYLLIAGDAIDGVGIYPSQESDLVFDSIESQYKVLTEMLQGLPDYIQIVYIPGNHEPVRNAIPTPAVPKKYLGELQSNSNLLCLGNPSTVAVHGVKALMYHGDSFIDFSMNVPSVSLDHPETAMIECLRGRHLAPSFGKKTELAPAPLDWLVIDEVPDFLHTGHIHINGLTKYHNVLCVGSGCFEDQTDYMKSLGINPTPGKPVIVRLYSPELQSTQLDLIGI